MEPSTAVLVTGGAGYVGAHVCRALATCGYFPVTLDSLERGDRSRVKWGPLVVGEAGNRLLVKETICRYSCEAVIHVAAYAFVGESMQYPARYYRNNLVVPLEVFDAASEGGVRAFVFSSTCSVYGDPGPDPVAEDAPLRPMSPYGTAKVIAERELAAAAAKVRIPIATLRLFNAVGNSPELDIGESHYKRFGRLVPDALQALSTGKVLALHGTDHPTVDGSPVRDFVHVEDLAVGHVLALEHALRGGTITCNLSTGQGHSVREVVAVVEAVAGRPLPVTWRAKRPGDPATILGAADLAHSVLGWRPRWSLRDAILHAFQWRTSDQANRPS